MPVERRLGAEGDGLKIALAGLDSGRRILDHQGLAFVLADMEAAVQTARAATMHASRLKDAGLPLSREASIAKLVATDSAR